MVTSPLKALPDVPVAHGLGRLSLWTVSDLSGRGRESLYAQLCAQPWAPLECCRLYTFCCVIDYVSTLDPDLAWLKGWNWKDKPG